MDRMSLIFLGSGQALASTGKHRQAYRRGPSVVPSVRFISPLISSDNQHHSMSCLACFAKCPRRVFDFNQLNRLFVVSVL